EADERQLCRGDFHVEHDLDLDLRLLLVYFDMQATARIYPLSLHDALPISPRPCRRQHDMDLPLLDDRQLYERRRHGKPDRRRSGDRKSTRLNSSHVSSSYAVSCLKKKEIGVPCARPVDGQLDERRAEAVAA